MIKPPGLTDREHALSPSLLRSHWRVWNKNQHALTTEWHGPPPAMHDEPRTQNPKLPAKVPAQGLGTGLRCMESSARRYILPGSERVYILEGCPPFTGGVVVWMGNRVSFFGGMSEIAGMDLVLLFPPSEGTQWSSIKRMRAGWSRGICWGSAGSFPGLSFFFRLQGCWLYSPLLDLHR